MYSTQLYLWYKISRLKWSFFFGLQMVRWKNFKIAVHRWHFCLEIIAVFKIIWLQYIFWNELEKVMTWEKIKIKKKFIHRRSL